MKGVLVHFPMKEGERVQISLRGVVGFCDILLRMMATIDAELSRSTFAEITFLDRLRNPQFPQPTTLSSRLKRRNEQIIKRCIVCGFPKPKDPKAIYNLLRESNVIGA